MEKTPPPGKNRLAFETSPYLLQHAGNPVAWRPWGEDAFAAARERGKLLLVSIGYSSCHWCHVMEHESFEDPAIARLMNEHFVPVKVDREERPDVDEICMNAVHVMGVPGGWPLNVFLTPEGKPFFGGTYFPPEARHGRIGWPDLLRRAAYLWAVRRSDVDAQADELANALRKLSEFAAADALPEAELFGHAADQIAHRFDEKHGGFGGAPKFPPHEALGFLLRRQSRTGGARELAMIVTTLERMARGGIYDQIGGGFHRYAVDDHWLVPHFEKMLPDNAQLARLYVEGHQLTGTPGFARIAREVYDYVLREMTEPNGGFRSATDADSDGREGIYFTWTRTDIDRLLGEDAAIFRRAYGVTEEGNFEDIHVPRRPHEEGQNVLSIVYDAGEIALQEGAAAGAIEARLSHARRKLFEARRSKPHPGIDDKILAAWNGMMIGSLAYGGRVLGEPAYVEAARKAADLVLRELRTKEGRLLRSLRANEAKIPAFLEDYACVAEALVDLYEATFETRWLAEARGLAGEMDRLFADDAGGWFHTGSDVDAFLTRMKTPTDAATPSANAVAARVQLRLAKLVGEPARRERAARAILLFRAAMERSPAATLGLLGALDLLVHDDGEIAIAGDPAKAATRELVGVVHRAYRPGACVALRRPDGGDEEVRLVPWLEGKTLVGGLEAVYLCRDYACEAPITDPRLLEDALAAR